MKLYKFIPINKMPPAAFENVNKPTHMHCILSCFTNILYFIFRISKQMIHALVATKQLYVHCAIGAERRYEIVFEIE